MGTISVFQSVTLDGVIQAPGTPDEDTRDGFAHGGWGNGYDDEVSMKFAAEGMASEGSLLFGRRTYESLMQAWTTTTEENPYTEVLLRARKYVVSRSSGTELAYPESTLLAGEAVETVAALRERDDHGCTILGSGDLTQALHAAGLIDEYVLLIHPIVLGSGRKLFGDGDRVDLTLQRSIQTTTGVLIARYATR